MVKLGEYYFNEADIHHIKDEGYQAFVFLKGEKEPIEIFPLKREELDAIREKK